MGKALTENGSPGLTFLDVDRWASPFSGGVSPYAMGRVFAAPSPLRGFGIGKLLQVLAMLALPCGS